MSAPFELERIAGALKGMDALRKLEQSTEFSGDDDSTTAGYYGKQLTDSRALVTALGSMTPEQEGFVATLAEYIHTIGTAGGVPDIGHGGWLPLSTMTDDERHAKINREQAENDEIDAGIEAETKLRRKVVSIEEHRSTRAG